MEEQTGYGDYGYIYLLRLSHFENTPVICYKLGKSDRSDINVRLNEHKKRHKCEPRVVIVIKTKSTAKHEVHLKQIFDSHFLKFGNTQEYYLRTKPSDMWSMLYEIQHHFLLINRQLNVEGDCCIYMKPSFVVATNRISFYAQHNIVIDLRTPVNTNTFNGSYDIEYVAKYGFSIPIGP